MKFHVFVLLVYVYVYVLPGIGHIVQLLKGRGRANLDLLAEARLRVDNRPEFEMARCKVVEKGCWMRWKERAEEGGEEKECEKNIMNGDFYAVALSSKERQEDSKDVYNKSADDLPDIESTGALHANRTRIDSHNQNPYLLDRIVLEAWCTNDGRWLVVISCPHSMGDGLSLAHYCGCLVREWRMLTKTRTDNVPVKLDVKPNPLRMKSSTELITPCDRDSPTAATTATSAAKANPDRFMLPDKLESGGGSSTVTNATGFISWGLGDTATKNFISACKSHGVTVNSGLGAAVTFALARRYSRLTGECIEGNYKLMTAVNLWKHFGRREGSSNNKPPLSMTTEPVLTTCTLPKNASLDNEGIWGLAKKYGEQVKESLQSSSVLRSYLKTKRKDGSNGIPGAYCNYIITSYDPKYFVIISFFLILICIIYSDSVPA